MVRLQIRPHSLTKQKETQMQWKRPYVTNTQLQIYILMKINLTISNASDFLGIKIDGSFKWDEQLGKLQST